MIRKIHFLFTALVFLASKASFSQVTDSSAQWTWISGKSVVSAQSVTTAPGPITPGSRNGYATWKDVAGNFWLFGGQQYTNGYVNDMWKYDLTSGIWSLVNGTTSENGLSVLGGSGVFAPNYRPGARTGACTWVDVAGNFWLFGGYGYGTSGGLTRLSDLWKYDITTNQWAWISGPTATGNVFGNYGAAGVFGPSYTPGGRSGGTAVTDAAGNFWLFGGAGMGASGAAGVLNDLWKYDVTLGQWAFMNGSSITSTSTTSYTGAVFGGSGVYDASYTPGKRYMSTAWVDATGTIWLFGGNGAPGGVNYLNDLWKYDPSINQWAWVKGSTGTNQATTYGTRGVATTNNMPGARYGCIAWLDINGKAWLFGGSTGSTANRMNELWMYDPADNQWTWMKGSNAANPVGVYGTQGTQAVNNTPGGRYNLGTGWKDASGNFWLYGGYGYAANTSFGMLNDLWRLSPVPCTINITASRPLTMCQGDSVILKAVSTSTGLSYQWFEGVTQVGTDTAYVAKTAGSYTVKITNSVCNSISAPSVVIVNPLPVVAVDLSSADAAICMGQDTTLTASGAVSYIWDPPAGLNATTGATVRANPATTTTYTVQGTGANGCIGVASRTVKVNTLPTITITPAMAVICAGKDTALTGNGGTSYTWLPNTYTGSGTTIRANPMSTTTYTVTGTDANGCQNTAARTVTVNALPNITISPSSAIICTGKDTALTASGGAAYGWLPATGLNTPSGAVVRASPAGTTTYTVTGMDANGCTDTASRVITVNPNPAVVINPTTAAICLGNDTGFTASGSITYSWTPATNLSSTTNAAVRANPTITTSYIVTGTDGNGCIGKDTQNVIVKSLPIAIISPSGTVAYCQYDSLLLIANNIIGANNTFQWKNNGSNVGSDTDKYMAKTTGSFTVTVTDSASCTATSPATIVSMNARPVVALSLSGPTSFCKGNAITMSIPIDTGVAYQWLQNGVDIPYATTSFYMAIVSGTYKVVATRAHVAACADTSQDVQVVVHPLPMPVILVDGANLSTDSTFVSYQWYYMGQSINGATTWKHTATKDGSYLVAVTDSNGCSNESPGHTVRHTSIEELQALATAIKMYPNPASANIYITSPIAVNVQIYSLTGQQIFNVKDAKSIDVSALVNGLYIAHIIDGDGQAIKVEKLFKQ